ncbi:hypothetical protein [Citrobacter amalonaticus]|uniref:Phage protein n=1 Tax=Citrobacter amalonaticus TaxID=35703 RepID=A0AAX2BQ08_CITAM|nr:hypothetical protein [Citrobacter amalonaticus]SBA31082.1 conserved protein of unknown function [Citrobacter amalonaticus]
MSNIDKQALTKVYVTKYALTEGPFSIDAEILYEGLMAVYSVNGYLNHVHGKDFWLTEQEALADCERRRQAKIKSLEKQKSKLEKMTFAIKEVLS